MNLARRLYSRFGALVITCALLSLVGTAPDASAGLFRRHQHQDKSSAPDCDPQVPAIASGYGADGPYKADMQSVGNPGFERKPVLVFLPQGASGKRPVIFFSHGYGPGDWDTYGALIDHMVSLGYVVVFSSYPMVMFTEEGRYDSLWKGFQAAADRYADHMDLSRVGFVGHSFGGGATPAMAYKGIVQQGWGKQGAFLMELAPWYSFQISDVQLQQFPAGVLQATQVYDKDSVNDHRMAIDIYSHTHVTAQYFFMVHSAEVNGCAFTADHATPGTNASLRQKQYAVFRPFDALADAAFNVSAAARAALAAMGAPAMGYQPLTLETAPTPDQPESYYKYPWSDDKNPRRN